MTPYSLTDIARYAEGDMSAEELQAFEQALAADATLRQQLALYHDVHSSLQQHFTKDAGQLQLEGTLQQMRGEFFTRQTKTAKIVSINRTLRYVMGVAAVLLITLFLWKPWQSLYDQYSDMQMINPAVRGDNADSLLQQAAIEFNNEEYEDASALLSEAQKLRPDDSFTNFYYGVTLMHLDQLLPARLVLGEIYDGSSVFKYEAAFYIALTYIKEKDKTSAREWLQKIPSDAANHGKAQELLRKL
jgi:tetratricopeptide (TPR) repeat protein